MPWSLLAGGLLSGKYIPEHRTERARRSQLTFRRPARARLRRCHAQGNQPHDVSVARVALAWMLAKSHVTSIVIGARTEAQLNDNLAATTLTLSEDQMAELDRVSVLPDEYPGWQLAWQNREPRL
jgi:aryl-alcohol dehydrogenase-like predicted oxidoreductase